MRDSQESKAVFASLVRLYVAPLLSAHGFCKSKLVWNRRRPQITQVLDIQVSPWSDDEELSFTINLGVLVERVWEILWDKPMPRTVQEVDCFPRIRLSYLLEEGPLRKDIWWTITPMTDIGAVGTELQGVLSEKCIPCLDKLDSISAIGALAEDPALRMHPAQLLSYAILKHLTSAREEGQQVLNTMLQRGTAWREHAIDVSKRLADLP